MGLKSFNPYTASRRFMTVLDKSHITKDTPEKNLLEPKKRSGGRNAHGEVTIRTGAWNTGWHHGTGFVQWTGSAAQRDALARVGELSRAVHAARPAAIDSGRGHLVDEAYWRLLRAQTSCNFFWGEDWVGRCHSDLDAAAYHLALANGG